MRRYQDVQNILFILKFSFPQDLPPMIVGLQPVLPCKRRLNSALKYIAIAPSTKIDIA